MSALHKDRIACFISPHGYGHAARAAAVMEAFHYLDPEKEFEIFTSVPEWFFRHSEYFHPDLVTASDALIGKVGYSTLSEVYWAGIPFGYVARSDFRESGVLVSYIENHMNGVAIEERDFTQGSFLSSLPRLLAMKRVPRQPPNGADQAALFIFSLMNKKGLSDET